GLGLTFVCNSLEEGAIMINRARALNPNLAIAWQFSGWTNVWLGEPETAIEHVARAMRLSPHDPHVFNMQAATACGHFFAGRDVEAASRQQRPWHVYDNSIKSTHFQSQRAVS